MINGAKRVVFVGGTSYSGSTMLDMILGNAPNGFSCGEMGALFYPNRRHHLKHRCGCEDLACKVWETVRNAGPAGAHMALFEMFPEVDFLIDSTKNPLWIREQGNVLERSGIDVVHILIWKAPQEFEHSRHKRERSSGWQRAWLHYHRAYMGMVKGWRAVRYRDLVESPDALKASCNHLKIPWFEGKERYWDKRHHILFGNNSAKIHLYDQLSEPFRACEERLRTIVKQDRTAVGSEYRTVENRNVNVQQADQDRTGDWRFDAIIRVLRERDVIDGIVSNTSKVSDRGGVDAYALYWTTWLRAKRLLGSMALKVRLEMG